jgi:hypothetical protein
MQSVSNTCYRTCCFCIFATKIDLFEPSCGMYMIHRGPLASQWLVIVPETGMVYQAPIELRDPQALLEEHP